MIDNTTAPASSGIDVGTMKRLYEAFQQGEPPSTPVPVKTQGAMAEVLETLFNELVQVEQIVVRATKPAKPATLMGKFNYAESALRSTEQRLSAFKTEDVAGSKVTKTQVKMKITSIKGQLLAAHTRQVDLSLEALTVEATSIDTQATELIKRAAQTKQLAGDAQGKAKNTLYKDASKLQTRAGVASSDWTGHVMEAKSWLVFRGGDFNKQIARIVKSESSLGLVVAFCLPALTSRPLGPNDPKPEIALVSVKMVTDAAVAMRECHNSWVEAKAVYGVNKDEMQKLADYRKRVVDDWLRENLGAVGLEVGPGKGWVSVGSSDPTSDYDISINKHGTDNGKPVFDHVLVKRFNTWFRTTYGGEGGTVFDTNLYASAPPLVTDENPDAASVNDIASLMKMRRYMTPGEFEGFRVETVKACEGNADQQMKVEQQFVMADNNYRMVVADLLDSGQQELAKRIAARTKDGGLDKLDKEALEQHEEEVDYEKQVFDWLKSGRNATGIAAYELIEQGEELSHAIDHHLKDAALLTTNEVYADKIGKVREQEQLAKLISDLVADLGRVEPGNPAEIVEKLKAAQKDLQALNYESKGIASLLKVLDTGEGTTPDVGAVANAVQLASAQLGRELGGEMQKLGNLNTIACYYANEAYQSEGPFAHVVTATQAAESEATAERVTKEIAGKLVETDKKDEAGKDRDPKILVAMARAGGTEAYGKLEAEEQKLLLAAAQADIDKDVAELKKKRQDAMSPDLCLQSFNEQLGDFLKDLEHYGDEEPGKAIIQSSKYLDRLQDATRLMADKNLFTDAGTFLEKINVELAMQKDVKGKLIAARKGNLIMAAEPPDDAPVDQQEQRRAFACTFMKGLGVRSVGELAKRYRTFGIKVNAIARKAIAAIPA